MALCQTNTSLSVDRIDAINAAHESCSRSAKRQHEDLGVVLIGGAS